MDSLAEPRAAVGAVWSAPGILAVIDQLETRP
ncbi:hypothetical protein [Cupriavidus campinensis]|nr:hypothetical protein [Cupriavidus campinensis]